MFSFIPYFCYLLMPSSTRGQGMRIAVSSSHVFAAPPPSFSSPAPVSPTGDIQELLQCEPFAEAAALHYLLQHGSSLSWGTVLPPRAVCFSAGLPQVHKSCLKTSSSTCSSIHGATGAARTLLHGFPWGHGLLWAHPLALALAWGPPWASGGCLLCCAPASGFNTYILQPQTVPQLFPPAFQPHNPAVPVSLQARCWCTAGRVTAAPPLWSSPT